MRSERCVELTCPSPVGGVRLRFEGGMLVSVELDAGGARQAAGTVDAACIRAREAVQRYFEHVQPFPDLELALRGTDFQLRVWQALREIPLGEVRTYGELAAQLGSSARAVGGACRRNPLPLVVPCHRVVARNGPGGFAGQTAGRQMAIKHWLLRHEGVEIPNL